MEDDVKLDMEKEIKNLLNCGYYDDCHNYIVELNEEKMKDFFKVFFKADTVIFNNTEMNKMKKENEDLQEKMDYMMEVHRKECEEMKCYIDKMAHEADQRTYKIMEEQEKRYNEMKENGRQLIKTIAKYI